MLDDSGLQIGGWSQTPAERLSKKVLQIIATHLKSNTELSCTQLHQTSNFNALSSFMLKLKLAYEKQVSACCAAVAGCAAAEKNLHQQFK
jgi:hypothetical protein